MSESNGYSDYQKFLDSKRHTGEKYGFEPTWIPDFLKPFQAFLTDWNIRKGKSATFADCGLGKSIMEFVVAQNVIEHTNKPALIACPLAVAHQMVREGEKFGIKIHKTRDGKVHKGINVTNYQRIHYYNPDDFSIVIYDEASILKHFEGKMRKSLTKFIERTLYRLLGAYARKQGMFSATRADKISSDIPQFRHHQYCDQ